MIGRDSSLTFALCASLVTHALLLGAAAEVYTRAVGNHIHVPGYGWMPNLEIEPPDSPRDRLGDPDGRGTSVLASAGDLPMQAPQATQDQPLYRRDPAGAGAIGEDAIDSALSSRAAAPSVAMSPPPQPPAPAAISPEQPAADLPGQIGLPPNEQDLARPFVPTAATPQPRPQPQPSPPASEQPTVPQPAANASGGAAGGAPGNPAPQGESDSDPVTTVGSADFRMGGLDVRLGRKFKLTRPHFSLAGQTDFYLMRTAIVVLKIRIDETGKVTSATIFRSSGSAAIDQPCALAAYGWWFEPLKDAKGQPTKDVLLFTLRFQ